jgi:hypothetical protein
VSTKIAHMPRCERTGSLKSSCARPAAAASKLAYFLQCVLPVIEDNWLRHTLALTHLESMYDSPTECDTIGCGPLAFAAIAGIPVHELHTFFPKIADRPWINRTEMERALLGFGWEFMKVASGWPSLGLCFIHWSGPWTDRGYAHGVLQRTHWVAVVGDYVFDVNWRGWLPKENWEDVVVPELLQNHNRACGWTPLTGYELCIRQ